MSFTIASLGTLILSAALASTVFGFAVALVAASNRPRLIAALRSISYATFALVAAATSLLAYAFQAHDYSIRYVAHYSDRSMTALYLLAALWGGQDGSLLWWTFMLAGLTAWCARGPRSPAAEPRPYVIAILLSAVGFFLLVMLFAADPFAKSPAGAPADGQGLNPMLHSFWMLIHPPVLYLGMVGWALPFAFAAGALITGELSAEWTRAARPWALFAWTALGAGNVLGMIWSYEVLGWGGYWAWDPVENASFLPMLSGTAYLHSALALERRAMFKLWSAALACLTFFLTIFGTFLTRSGLIASVHAFSSSGMGIYFVIYMALIAAFCLGLLWLRRSALRPENRIESLLSREFAFAAADWLLMGMLAFTAIATVFPLISAALWRQTVTVGAGFYNRWMAPLGLLLLLLLGFAPLLPWRAETPARAARALLVPAIAAAAVALMHFFLGAAVGFPPWVRVSEARSGYPGRSIAAFYGYLPLFYSALCAWAFASHAQDLWRRVAARARDTGESAALALGRLLGKSRRRYGAYLVHLGTVLMCLGFTGSLYDQEKQAPLTPGQSVQVGGCRVRFDGARMELEPTRRALLADLVVLEGGRAVGAMTPGKYFYDKPEGASLSEVAIRSGLRQDIYVILNSVNPADMVGTFRIMVRPLVAWIWIGSLLALLGALICLGSPRPKKTKE